MKIQSSALLIAVAASTANAFVTQPKFFQTSRTGVAPLKDSAIEMFELPNIEDEVSVGCKGERGDEGFSSICIDV
jgi:hypothetical protein